MAMVNGHDHGPGSFRYFSRRVSRSVVDYEDFVGLF
jgi:hypothetical protein